ncbi:MAG: hypothetical protein JXR83_11775 [Deltaproteobacteria bacterium]|nr:hypothetical protein [Deltaproteobacteria bacterium]
MRHRLLPGRAALMALALAPAALALADEVARFRPLDIIVDVGDRQLAAYQIELVVRSGDATIVGVEGGEPAAFKAAPYYDPAALAGGRIVIAAYSTDDPLPSGRVRVATLHMRELGEAPRYQVKVLAAASGDGQPLSIAVEVQPRTTGGER